MVVLDELRAATAVDRLRLSLKSLGVEVRQESNPTKALATLNKLNDGFADAKIATWLDPNLTVLTEQNSFWLFCYDESWSVIGKTGTRIDDTGGESYGAFASRALQVIHRDRNGTPVLGRMPRAAYNVSGRIAFCGDTYLVPHWRDQRIPKLLISINYLIMGLRWGCPDWTTCFLRPWQAKEWDWTKRYWEWHHETASFIKPAETDFKGHSLGLLSKDGFRSEIRDAANLHLPLSPASGCQNTCGSDQSYPSDLVAAES